MRGAFESELTSPALLAGLAEWDACPRQAKAQALEEVREGLATTTGNLQPCETARVDTEIDVLV